MKIFKWGIFLSILLILISCNNDDDNKDDGSTVQELSIYETAISSPDLTILVEALERTGLSAILDQSGTYTVFAPTDEAFANAGITLDDFTEDELKNLLLNHVLGKVVLSANLTTGYVNTLATGYGDHNISLFINTEEGIKFNATSLPVPGGLDIEATNGVIHLVDTPIGIPDVGSHLVINPEFNGLEEALSTHGAALIEELQNEGPFTIFAPSFEAFEKLASTLDVSSLSQETITSILGYHVIIGENLRAEDLTDGRELTTASGEILKVDLTNGVRLIDGTGGSGVHITETNIQGSNGVIHLVDRVLLPPSAIDATMGQASLYQMAQLTPGFEVLATAIEISGLTELLSDPGANLTVFAPDNDAFFAYLETLEGINSLTELDSELLANLLLNHIVEGQYTSTAILETGSLYTNTMATVPNQDKDRLSLYINTDEGVTLNGDSKVTYPDTQAANGIIHLVDKIVKLPTVVTFVTADPNLSSLTETLSRVEESAGYIAALSTPRGTDPAPFTVFVPHNTAFTSLLQELEIDNPEVLDPSVVELTLAYHVITGTQLRADDLIPGTATTLGGEINISTENGVSITDANGRISEVTVPDIQAYNGVIHLIDKVILPLLN